MARNLDLAAARAEFLQLQVELLGMEALARQAGKSRVTGPRYKQIVERMYAINSKIPDGQKFSFEYKGHQRRPQQKGLDKYGKPTYKMHKVDRPDSKAGEEVPLELYKKRAALKGLTEEDAEKAYKRKERLRIRLQGQVIDGQIDHANPRNPKDQIVRGLEHPRNYIGLRTKLNASKSNKRDLKALREMGVPLSPEEAVDMDLENRPIRKVPARQMRGRFMRMFGKGPGSMGPRGAGAGLGTIERLNDPYTPSGSVFDLKSPLDEMVEETAAPKENPWTITGRGI